MILTQHKINQVDLATASEDDIDYALAEALAELPEADRIIINQAVAILSDEIDGVGVKIALEIVGKLGLLLTQ